MTPRGMTIRSRDLGLRTSAGWVYRGIDLDVPPGSLAVVTGPARSGKTALLLTLAAHMKAGEGDLSVAGLDARRRPGAVRRLTGLGEFRGVNALDETLTVADQVMAELALHGRLRGSDAVSSRSSSRRPHCDGAFVGRRRPALARSGARIHHPPAGPRARRARRGHHARGDGRSAGRAARAHSGRRHCVAGTLDHGLAPAADVALELRRGRHAGESRRPCLLLQQSSRTAHRRSRRAPPVSPSPSRCAMRSVEIAILELKRLISASPFRVIVAVVCLVPLLYGVLYLWAFWDPYQRLDKLPVALVVNDLPAHVDGTTVHVGKDLVAELRKATASTGTSSQPSRRPPGSRTAPTTWRSPCRRTSALGWRTPTATTRTRRSCWSRPTRGPTCWPARSARGSSSRCARPFGGHVAGYLDHIFVGLGTCTDRVRARRRRRGELAQRAGQRELRSQTLASGISSADSGARTLQSGSASCLPAPRSCTAARPRRRAEPAASRPA